MDSLMLPMNAVGNFCGVAHSDAVSPDHVRTVQWIQVDDGSVLPA